MLYEVITGLYSEYGIMELIESIAFIEDQTTEIWICGNGPLADIIEKISEENKRVKYLGMVSHEESLLLHVITSYSIHYTKLYDEHRAAVGDHADQVRARGELAGLRRIALNFLAGGRDPGRIGEREVALRITSYNVCYTKLLRRRASRSS